jgi:cytochrome oxidase assembly protein ShyY1
MHAFEAIVRATSTPVPTPTMTVPAESVTPGVAGFLVIALLVVGVFLLVWDMQRRIRRARYRDEVNEQLDREAAQAGASAPDTESKPGTEPK